LHIGETQHTYPFSAVGEGFSGLYGVSLVGYRVIGLCSSILDSLSQNRFGNQPLIWLHEEN